MSLTDAANADGVLLEAMPDLWMEPCTLIGQNEYVLVPCCEEATFTNALGELPPTNEKWSLNIQVLFRFEEGLVKALGVGWPTPAQNGKQWWVTANR
jgi:hypothetical protein